MIAEELLLENNWKLQASNVCLGAKGNSYGQFVIRHTGSLTKLKLQHRGEASLTCSATLTGTRWGCLNYGKIFIALTDQEDVIKIPDPAPAKNLYLLPGFHGNSDFITFTGYSIPVQEGDVFKIWYLEDLRNVSEHDNTGRSCADVYVTFCD